MWYNPFEGSDNVALNINGILIKDRFDYIEKGERKRINSSMRKDLAEEYSSLMKQIKKPQSVGFDVMVEMLQDNENLLTEFVKRVRRY